MAALLVSAPFLWTSFIGDDAFYANIDGWLAAHHGTLLDAFKTELLQEDLRKGRFHPLFVALTLVQFHLAHDPFPLKLAHVLVLGFDVGIVWLLVRELGGSAARAGFAAAVAVLGLQLRVVYDATTSDNLHLPLTAACALGAMWLLVRALRTGSALAYVLSVIAFAAAALFYEVLLVLALPAVVFAVRARRPLHALPFAAFALADAGAIVAIRTVFPQTGSAIYAVHLAPFADAQAAAVQIVSTVPFLYELIDPHGVFHASGTYWPLVALVAVALLAAAAAWRGAGVPAEVAVDRPALCWIGATLLIAPALVVAAVPAYAASIALAVPYAPVALQGFGLALLAAALPLPRPGPALAASGAAAFAVVLVANALVAGRFGYWTYPRDTIVAGLVHGAAAGVPPDAPLYLDASYAVNNVALADHLLWNSAYFYRLWGGRTWTTAPLASEHLAAGADAYELRSVANDAHHGTLIVAHVRGRAGDLPPALVDAAVFERGRATGSAFAAADFTPLAEGPGWTLAAFHPRCSDLPNDALAANLPSVARVSYGDGFSVAESDGAHRWRWGGHSATLTLANPTGAPIETVLSAGIGTVGAGRGTATVNAPDGTARIAYDANEQPLRIVARIAAHATVALTIATDAPNVALPGDTRDLRFRLLDPTLTDRSGCATPDAAR